jgi:choline dehydrogenase-like flavoprotein
MLLDLQDASGSVRRQGEVCVIGAGAAGICVARRLLAGGHDVILLESGGTDYEARTADLNAGASIGEPYYPLDHARLRFFGGTTAIWGGRCAELDPIDLERRDWVPHSGWPLSIAELRPYYDLARPLFGLAPCPPSAEDLRGAGVPLPDFEPRRLRTPIWSFDARFNRFTFGSCADLGSHPRCTIVLHATVTSLEAAASGRQIRHVVARSLSGRRLEVEARAVVLAGGGIENARLLLASRSVRPSGLGNEHDLVGRFFMEHPHARGGRVITRRAWPLLKAFGRRHRIGGEDVAALIAPSPELQRERQLLNSSLTITARQPEGASPYWGMRLYSGLKHDLSPTRTGRALWMHSKKIANWAQRHTDPLRPWLLHKSGKAEVTLLVRAEQAPNPDSRIRLSGETDALGMRRATLDWRFSSLDRHSVAVLVETLGGELRRLGYGEVEAARWLSEESKQWQFDPIVSSHPIGGYHHIGTTRMSADPRQGVVRSDGRLHSVENLYVVGSSTFPTSSWANPTLTIAALALRTADRIAMQLALPAASAATPLAKGRQAGARR